MKRVRMRCLSCGVEMVEKIETTDEELADMTLLHCLDCANEKLGRSTRIGPAKTYARGSGGGRRVIRDNGKTL